MDSLNEETFSKLTNSLNKTSNALMFSSLIQYRKLMEEKITNLDLSKAKKDVYDLCNGENNVNDITKKLGLKSHSTVSIHLKNLYEDKIVFRKKDGNETYPITLDALIDNKINSSLED